MTTESTTAYIDAAALALELHIKPEWKPNVAAFFEVARGMADLIEKSGAPYNSESAPIFALRDVE